MWTLAVYTGHHMWRTTVWAQRSTSLRRTSLACLPPGHTFASKISKYTEAVCIACTRVVNIPRCKYLVLITVGNVNVTDIDYRLRNIRYIFNTILAITLWRVLIAKSTLAVNSWYFVLGLVFKFIKFFRITSSVSMN
jgi:hypothetical protein